MPEWPHLKLSPNEMYEIGIAKAGLLRIPAAPELACEFLQVRMRTIQHYGVEVDGLRYNGDALNPYRNEKSPYVTSAPSARTLPLRVRPLPGECLDSWLEALARRNGISVSVLLPAFGWKAPPSAARLSPAVAPGTLRRAETQAGRPGGRLDSAVFDPYLPLGPVRRDGSRYCPQCLAASGGRWMLSWRLPWTFACTVHGTVLADDCPACGRPPRRNLSWAGLNPACTCPAPAGDGKRCEAGLDA
ncbi:MAG: TniQ family protein, partial [Trebonia sp.]